MALGVSGTATPLRDNRRSDASRRKSPNSYKCRSLFDIRSIREFYETSATDRREKHDVQQRTSGAALGHSSAEVTMKRLSPASTLCVAHTCVCLAFGAAATSIAAQSSSGTTGKYPTMLDM